MSYTIYIADDEDNIRELIRTFLESDGYTVKAFRTGDDLYSEFLLAPADLVILDIMMPGTDGMTICQKLREITTVPIIMLTAKDSEFDYVRGITLGSDDYLTKPFRPTSLLMRVRALLRRTELDKTDVSVQGSGNLSLGDLAFNQIKNEITCKGEPLHLTPTELKLLTHMMRNTEKSYSREELLNEIWDFNSAVETRVTDEAVRKIRKKLSAADSNVRIETLWGFGYCLKTEASAT